MSKPDFRGKVVVITGSSKGIGKAIALEFAARGCSIVLNGRNKEVLKAAEEEVSKRSAKVISVCADVSTPEGGALLIEEAVKVFGRVDILVNNVGVSMRGAVADLEPAVYKTIFESNILGAVNPTIPAIKYLRVTKGSMVFISSNAGIRGLPFLSAYSSSKMALRAIAESIRIEEKENDIHVGLIYVGYTENEGKKETIASDGSRITLLPRKGKGVESRESVAKAVVKNVSKRKFITVLTRLGKLNFLLQPLFPNLVERLIIKNLARFREEGK